MKRSVWMIVLAPILALFQPLEGFAQDPVVATERSIYTKYKATIPAKSYSNVSESPDVSVEFFSTDTGEIKLLSLSTINPNGEIRESEAGVCVKNCYKTQDGSQKCVWVGVGCVDVADGPDGNDGTTGVLSTRDGNEVLFIGINADQANNDASQNFIVSIESFPSLEKYIEDVESSSKIIKIIGTR